MSRLPYKAAYFFRFTNTLNIMRIADAKTQKRPLVKSKTKSGNYFYVTQHAILAVEGFI